MKPLPKALRIGPFSWTVTELSKDVAEAQKIFARCNNPAQTIEVCTAYKPQQTAEALIHEVLHAIYWTGAISDSDDEERTVEGLGLGLTQVIRDNPELMTFLKSCLK